MSNMATKSDFAQKLLTDLRQRKERMAAAQNSSRQSSQTSRGKILVNFPYVSANIAGSIPRDQQGVV